jgi:hypothetical protein
MISNTQATKNQTHHGVPVCAVAVPADTWAGLGTVGIVDPPDMSWIKFVGSFLYEKLEFPDASVYTTAAVDPPSCHTVTFGKFDDPDAVDVRSGPPGFPRLLASWITIEAFVFILELGDFVIVSRALVYDESWASDVKGGHMDVESMMHPFEELKVAILYRVRLCCAETAIKFYLKIRLT